jgi:hypothetical protein
MDIAEQRELLEQAGALALRLNATQILSSGKGMAQLISLGLEPRAVEETQRAAKTQLQDDRVRERICEALKTSSEDLREMAKVIGAALLPLMITGVIALPATPLGIAVAALIVYRAGISAYCASTSDKV